MSREPIPKKSLGQHWLHDEDALQAMLTAAALHPSDAVLEIGPGLGTLTRKLTETAKEVIAVEYDNDLAHQLPNRVPAKNLRIVESDILSFDLTQLPAGYKVVANIPYYLTSNLIRVLSESSNPPTMAVLLVQKEVAERVAAVPGGMSILSVTAQWYWEVSVGPIVQAELFTPPPKVDSQILILRRRVQPLFPKVDTPTLFRLVKAGFSQRRKTLSNSLAGGLQLSRQDCQQLLETADLNPNARAQTLSLEDWYHLYHAYSAAKA